MTLYLDTSSAIKLYVAEAGSDKVRTLVEGAAVVATSVVTYADTRAALARLRRERALTAATFRSAKREFEAQWPHFIKLDATDALYLTAGELAAKSITCEGSTACTWHRLSRLHDERGRAKRGSRASTIV